MPRSQPAADADWVARLADEVVAESERRSPGRPVVCASGISPSGPIHLGNLREVMVPHLVADEIRRRGIDCEHLVSWDDFDRFRKVPAAIEGIEQWNAHIGKPLTSVPAPPGSDHPSWAAHFRASLEESLADLGIAYRGISQTERYTAGAYRGQILHAMRHRAAIDAVLARHRTKDVAGTDPAYYPYKPYCHTCLRDTTSVLTYDEVSTVLTYRCSGGHTGSMRLAGSAPEDSHGKLVWKVDWPMRWAYERVVFEPAGVDHHSPGSSWVVGEPIARDVFGWPRPIGPMYAFVGISGMSKMSSSRGGVPTPADALAIMEPPLLRWLYARRRPHQSFTVAFDAEVHRLYDEWDALERKVASAAAKPGDMAMHARSVGTADGLLPATPRPLAYRALASVVDITGGNPDQVLRILTTMDAGSGRPPATSLADFQPRLDKAREWVRTHLPPDERTLVRAEPDTELLDGLDRDQRGALRLLAEHLEDDWSLTGLTTLVYGVPKLQAGLDVGEKNLPAAVKTAQRDLFALLYRLLIGSDTGPRLPTLLLCIGPERTRRLVGVD